MVELYKIPSSGNMNNLFSEDKKKVILEEFESLLTEDQIEVCEVINKLILEANKGRRYPFNMLYGPFRGKTEDGKLYDEVYYLDLLSKLKLVSYEKGEMGIYILHFSPDELTEIVEIFLDKIFDKHLKKVISTNKLNIPKEKPREWQLSISENDKKAHLIKNNEIVYTFPTLRSEKFKYFNYLWNNYGVLKSYKSIYECEGKRTYDLTLKGKINSSIRNTINKLKREKDFKKTLIEIEADEGYTLYIP